MHQHLPTNWNQEALWFPFNGFLCPVSSQKLVNGFINIRELEQLSAAFSKKRNWTPRPRLAKDMNAEFHNGTKCAKPVSCTHVKVLAYGALCEQSKRVAYQMMAIKGLRDCG